MKNTIKIVINKKCTNLTIKEYLKFYHVGRGKIEEIRTNNEIFVNDNQVSLEFVLKENDILKITSEEKVIIPYAHNIDVIYEDDFFIAVNKPRNILVHSDGDSEETLINYIAYYLITTHKKPIVYPLHRLDYETLGVILFAKNFLACSIMSFMFDERLVNKEYLLLCKGHFAKKEGDIILHIGKDRHNAKKMVVLNKGGLIAKTHYKVIKEHPLYSKVQVKILTGRKHQIRVCFAHLNHPLIGDKLYGNVFSEENLQLLSYILSFIHPFYQRKITIKSIDNLI